MGLRIKTPHKLAQLTDADNIDAKIEIANENLNAGQSQIRDVNGAQEILQEILQSCLESRGILDFSRLSVSRGWSASTHQPKKKLRLIIEKDLKWLSN